jgi:hypothetical protein
MLAGRIAAPVMSPETAYADLNAGIFGGKSWGY